MSSTYLIFGQDEYRVSGKAKEIIEKIVPPESRIVGLETINGAAETIDAVLSALGKCFEAVQTLGFFGGKKVVWFRDVSFLGDGVAGKSDAVKQRVNEFAEMIRAGLPAGQVLVVTAPKVDGRTAFYKACREKGEVLEFEVPDKAYLAERQAADQLDDMLAEAGLRMSGDVRDLFLEKVGSDTRHLANEVEKLGVFLGDRKEVRLDDVEAVTSSLRGALAWDLADAVGNRKLDRALEILRRLVFQKESPIGLVAVVENRVRDLMVYREALDRGWLREGRRGGMMEWGKVPPEVETTFSREFGRDPRMTHPYRAGLLARQAKLFSPAELEKCANVVVEAHRQLVSSVGTRPMALEIMLVRMLS